MAGSVNQAILVGNLGRDPEIRRTQAGDPIAQLSVATSESWRDRQTGERQERTEWHRVVIFGKLAEVAERFLLKGSKVYLEGQIRTRKWQDQGGAERYTTEIVLTGFDAKLVILSGGRDAEGQGGAGGARGSAGSGSSYTGYGAGGGSGGGSNAGAGATTGRGKPPPAGAGGPDWGGDLDDEIPF